MDIALNIIIGPFHEPFFGSAINSCMNIIDEMVIVDTFPQDNPNRPQIEAVRCAFPDVKVLNYERPSLEEFDYAAARTLAQNNTESEWILRLDADEVLPPALAARLHELSDWSEYDCIATGFWHHMLHPDYYVITRDPKRILLRKEELEWYKPVHEHAHIKSEKIWYENDYRYLYNHYGYVRGPQEVYKRWKLYDNLEGLDFSLAEVNPDTCINNQYAKLIQYSLKHPPAVIRTLKSLYPDLGTFPLEEDIKQHRILEGRDAIQE